jgi:acyl-CoA synthetase (AMP-forming)/AMP-acid ligase II/acyl carrier protein
MPSPFGHATLLQRLDSHARTQPHKPFLILYHGAQFQVLTYADLRARTYGWAQRLAALAAPAGGRVFLMLRHGPDAYAAFLGAQAAGLIPAFLPPPSSKQEPKAFWAAQQAVFERADAVAAVVGAVDAPILAETLGALGRPLLIAEDETVLAWPEAPTPAALESPALLQHSSGTTGLKKAVQLSFEQVDRHAGMVAAALKMTERDIVASWLPLYHDMGLFASFLTPLTLGASVVALDTFAWAADPSAILRVIEQHRASLCWMPNFALAHLVRTRPAGAAFDLSSLRALINCSEPCRPETVDDFCAAFADAGLTADKIACSYGMAEVVFAATQTEPGSAPRVLEVDAHRLERSSEVTRAWGGRTHRFLSCGKPIPGVDLRIAEPAEGVDLRAGAIRAGEIEVASATLFDGYHHGDGAPLDPPVDGWRRTGDYGFLHDGELFVCGRTMERLIVHGRTLYAGDVEAAASAVCGVKAGRAVALGVQDEATGGEEAWLMLEAEKPLVDREARDALVRAVKQAVQQNLDLTLRGVEIGPPGWLAKSTAGKMSRADNLQKLHRLLAQQPKTPALAEREPTLAPAGAAAPAPLSPPELAAEPPPAELQIQSSPPPAPSHAGPPDGEPPVAAAVEAAPIHAPPVREPGSARAAVMQALAECFGPEGAKLAPDCGFGDVRGWDSLGHTVLVLRIEALSGLKATEAQVAGARTVAQLIALFDGVAPDSLEEREAA